MNRLRKLVKQIYYWGAVELECSRINNRAQRLYVAQIDQNVEPAAEPIARGFIQARHIKEQEFIWKSKVFCEQPVAHKRPRCVWQHSFIRTEPDCFNARCRQ